MTTTVTRVTWDLPQKMEDALRARIAELEAALRPFAELDIDIHRDVTGSAEVEFSAAETQWFDRARAALTS